MEKKNVAVKKKKTKCTKIQIPKFTLHHRQFAVFGPFFHCTSNRQKWRCLKTTILHNAAFPKSPILDIQVLKRPQPTHLK